MILGLFGRRPISEPAWFSALPLQCHTALEGGAVHLASAQPSSVHRSAHLSVVVGPGRTGPGAGAIADAFSQFGPGAIERLRGPFRFILHDGAAGQLFAAASVLPALPLAYWSDSGTTLVCSHLLPMLRCPGVPRALDESYLVHLVMGLSAMRGGSTALQGIQRLRPGEALLVDSSGPRVLQLDRLKPREPRQERAATALVERLGETVGTTCERGHALVSLSGGLDSAALVGAGLRSTKDIDAIAFVAPGLDRSAEIESIATMARAWPHLRVTSVDASDATDLPHLGGELRDDPFLTPLALLPARMRLWARARDVGATTVIEGEGGDELFSMLPTPLDALRHGHLVAAARRVMGDPARRALIKHALVLPVLPRAIRRAWLLRRQPIEAHLPAYAAWGAAEHPLIRRATGEYLETLVHRPFAERLHEWLSAPMVVGAWLSRRHLAAGFGLELEWPMLERSTLELVLGLHAAGALPGGPEKAFLRTALTGIVPDEVRLRSKSIGLYLAFIPRVLTSPRSRQVLRDERVRARLADLVRFERVEAMLDGLAAGRSLSAGALWHLECLVAFAEWYARASREYGVD